MDDDLRKEWLRKVNSPNDWEWCRVFIDHYCIFRSPPNEFVLSGAEGNVQAWQFYLPIAVLNPEFAQRVSRLFWEWYEPQWYGLDGPPFQLCGCESGGSLLVSVLQAYAPLAVSAFMIKKAAKSYGLGNRLEGIVDPELPVLLVDDVIGSGKTMRAQWHRLEEFGLKPMGCFAVAACKDAAHLGQKHNPHTLYKPSDFARLHTEYMRKYAREPQFMGTVI
jgi:orotate phosphoribosyltransferase